MSTVLFYSRNYDKELIDKMSKKQPGPYLIEPDLNAIEEKPSWLKLVLSANSRIESPVANKINHLSSNENMTIEIDDKFKQNSISPCVLD